MVDYTLPQLTERYWIDKAVLSATLASFTVLVYDHVLTIGDEINYMWGKKLTPISVLFRLNRYFTLLSLSVYLAALTSVPMTSADGTTPSTPLNIHTIEIIVVLTIVSPLIAEMMLIMRVSAVFRNNKFMIAFLTFLWVSHLTMMIAQVVTQSSMYLATDHISQILYLGRYAGLLFVVPAAVFDTIIGSLLIFGLYRNSGQFWGQMPFARLIMRDGLLYFFVVFVSNITWVLTQVILQEHMGPHSVLREGDITPVSIWSACITTTMIGRLTLNIRKYDPSEEENPPLARMKFRLRGE